MVLKKAYVSLLSVFLCFAVFMSLVVPVFAASQTATFSLVSKQYSSSSQKFINQSQFYAGDTVYVAVSSSAVQSLGGIMFSLEYDPSIFTFNQAKSVCLISDSSGLATINAASSSKINVLWETTSSSCSVIGDVFYIVFTVNSSFTATQGTFKLTVSEIYDGTNAQNNISVSVAGTLQVGIAVDTIPNSVITALQKLSTITYPYSWNDILAAETAFISLTNRQQTTLQTQYPDLFSYLSNARTLYYRAADNAAQSQILAEVQNYINSNGAVWSMNVSTVTLADDMAVTRAAKGLEILSPAAKALLDSSYKIKAAALEVQVYILKYSDIWKMTPQTITLANAEALEAAENGYNGMSSYGKNALDSLYLTKLSDLDKAINILHDAEEKEAALATEIQDYLDGFDYLYNQSLLDSVDSIYSEYDDEVSEALLYFNDMSVEAKKALEDHYQFLIKLQYAINVCLSNDSVESAILDRIVAFQTQWHYVYTLNENTVKLTDKAAINMVIDAYKALKNDDPIKQRLLSKYNQFNNLLSVIDALENEKKSSADVVTPTTSTATGSNSQVVTKTEVITKTQTQTINSTANKLYFVASHISISVLVLLILLALSVICLIISYYMLTNSKKKASVVNIDAVD